MLFIFMGQSCTGKSTAADKLKEQMNVEIYSGKDYLRMAKNESEAWKLFCDKLEKAAINKDKSKESIIYVITEIELLNRVKSIEDAYMIKFNAPLEIIKTRFADRMNGRLPQPVEKMIERQYLEWESVTGDLDIDTSDNDIEEMINIASFKKEGN
jgi:adenylate kinase family enzyme